MKKIGIYLFVATIGFTSLASCADDDNNQTVQPQPTSHLLGSWKLNTMTVRSYKNGELVYESIDAPVANQATWEYTFKPDNKVDYYTVIPVIDVDERGTGTYTRNGNILTITIKNEVQALEISKSDANNLHLKFSEEEIEGDVTFTDEIEQKFVRK